MGTNNNPTNKSFAEKQNQVNAHNIDNEVNSYFLLYFIRMKQCEELVKLKYAMLDRK